MEVHAHAHTARKKWTHYLWEFLMLFLAVFCGFLAENKREHLVEHQRAKVYAANLYEELKKDTATLVSTINNNEYVSAKLDSFCLFSRETKGVSSSKLYFYSSFITSTNFFSSNNTTIEELKGSGNLRILGNE
jgi:predicted MPP superfamily phosphohydrolase